MKTSCFFFLVEIVVPTEMQLFLSQLVRQLLHMHISLNMVFSVTKLH